VKKNTDHSFSREMGRVHSKKHSILSTTR